MRLLWPLLLIAFGTLVLVHAVGLSERFDAWTSRLRGKSSQPNPQPTGNTRSIRTKIVTAVLRVVGVYLILAGVVGLFGILISK